MLINKFNLIQKNITPKIHISMIFKLSNILSIFLNQENISLFIGIS